MFHYFVVPQNQFFVIAVNNIEFFKFVNDDSFESKNKVQLMHLFIFCVNIANISSLTSQSSVDQLNQSFLNLIRQLIDFFLSDHIQQKYALFSVKNALWNLFAQTKVLFFADNFLGVEASQFAQHNSSEFAVEAEMFGACWKGVESVSDSLLQLGSNVLVDFDWTQDNIDAFIGRHWVIFAFPLFDYTEGKSRLIYLQGRRPFYLKQGFTKALHFCFLDIPFKTLSFVVVIHN